MSSTPVPPELIFIILNEISSSRDPLSYSTLSSFSLTSHSWHTFIRPLLFQSITITSLDILTKFLALLDSTTQTNTDIAGVVKEITIINVSTVKPSRCRSAAAKARMADTIPLPSLSTESTIRFRSLLQEAVYKVFPFKLPSVESLHFYRYFDDVQSFDDIQNLHNLKHYTNVKKVVFDTCFLSPSVTRAFAYTIPNLRHYTLNEIRYLKAYQPVDIIERELELLSPSRPHLSSYTCYPGMYVHYGERLQRLLDLPSFKFLRSLSIMFEVAESLPFEELLQTASSTLEHFSLEITSGLQDAGTYEYTEYINLSQFPNLKTFYLRPYINPLSILARFLPQLNTSTSLSLAVIAIDNTLFSTHQSETGEDSTDRTDRSTLLEALGLSHPLLSTADQSSSLRPRIIFAHVPFEGTEEGSDSQECSVPPLEAITRESSAHHADDCQKSALDTLASSLGEIFREARLELAYELMTLERAVGLCGAKPVE